MKKTLLSAAILCGLAGAGLAQSVTVEVTSLSQRDNGGKLGAPDVCTVAVRVQNGTGAMLGLGLEVLPAYTAGSFSEMVAPAGTSFGRKNEVGFYGLASGDGMDNDVSILGALCDDMEALELVPRCQEADGTFCNAAIVISPDSIIATAVQGGETAGARAAVDIGPVGPLHGGMMISAAQGGQVILVLDIVHPDGDSAKGTYVASAAICEAAGLAAGCELAGKTGETEFGRVMNDVQASLGVRLADYDEGRVSFHWDLNTGEGVMRNIAGQISFPIRVQIIQ